MKFFLVKKNIILSIIVILAITSSYFVYIYFQNITQALAYFENNMIEIFKEYGYFILFGWSVLEGETGLFMAGLLSYSGDMNLYLAIFVAGLGGFFGDQLYFYIGRYNKNYVHKKFSSQRRKFALAHLLLKKYGWGIIFIQRYMYGLRTIIPISIGLTKYSAKSFAFINLISAWCWASITIVPIWYFGEEILKVIDIAKEYWYVVAILIVIFFSALFFYFKQANKSNKNSYKETYKTIHKQIKQLDKNTKTQKPKEKNENYNTKRN